MFRHHPGRLLLSLALLPAALPAAAPMDPPPRDLAALCAAHAAQLGPILPRTREHRVQVLLAEPVARADGTIGLRRSRLGDPHQYFYPASSVKLCAAVAALLELNARNGREGTAWGLGTALRIEPRFAGDQPIASDPTNVDGGALTVGHCIRQIFLVSDNSAFNHLYELVGHRRLNEVMWEAGFHSVRLQHRLSEARPAAEQRQSRPVVLRDGDRTQRIVHRDSTLALANDLWTDLQMGEARMENGRRVEGPLSFETKNAVLLEDLQDMLIALVRPEITTGKRGFPGLSVAQRHFLVQAMGELPRESRNPVYDPAKFPDDYVKYLLPGLTRVIPAAHLRIYSKVGCAYGNTTENAWIEDTRTGRGFALAAVVYTNPDGVMNDDEYAYATLAYPFLANVAEIVSRAVLAP